MTKKTNKPATKKTGTAPTPLTPQEDAFRIKYFNRMFKKEVIKTRDQVNTNIVCTSDFIRRALEARYNKNTPVDKKTKDSLHEYLQYCASRIWEMTFLYKPIISWEAMYKGEDVRSEKQLTVYINRTLSLSDSDYFSPDRYRIHGTKRGGTQGLDLVYRVNNHPFSFFWDEKNQKDSLIPGFIHGQRSVFDTESFDYTPSYYQKWFDDNKKELLTERQLHWVDFMQNLDGFNGYNQKEICEMGGVKSGSIVNTLKSAYVNIPNAWDKNKVQFKNKIEMKVESDTQLLTAFLDLANDETDLDNQNKQLSQWIKDHYSIDLIMDLLDKVNNGNTTATIETNRYLNNKTSQLPSSVLYGFIQAVEAKIERLKEVDCTVKPVVKKKREEEKKEELLAKVYDMDGNFLRTEKTPVKKHKTKTRVVYTLPGGTHCFDYVADSFKMWGNNQ